VRLYIIAVCFLLNEKINYFLRNGAIQLLCVLFSFGKVDLPLLTTVEKTVHDCANASLNYLVCCCGGGFYGIFLHWPSWPWRCLYIVSIW